MKRMVAVALFLLSALGLAQTKPEDKLILIRSVTLSGAPHLPAEKRESILRSLRGQQRTLKEIDDAAERLRQAMQQQGYFKAIVYEPELKVRSDAGDVKTVDIQINTEEGTLYYLGELRLENVKVFRPDEVRALFHISTGEVFNCAEIKRGLDRLRKLYEREGYLTVTPVPDTRFEPGSDRVTVTIEIDEGRPFTAGKLIVEGNEAVPGAAEKLSRAWVPYEGRTFTPDLLNRLLRDVHASPKVRPQDVFKTSFDMNAGLVNVTITLTKPFN